MIAVSHLRLVGRERQPEILSKLGANSGACRRQKNLNIVFR